MREKKLDHLRKVPEPFARALATFDHRSRAEEADGRLNMEAV